MMRGLIKTTLIICVLLLANKSKSQDCYWQQYVHYTMDIQFNDARHQFKGKQKLLLVNHSPDTLNQLFYHLYFNAFQPGSAMDVRSRNIVDPDPRIGARISNLKKSEYGFQKIESLTMNGKFLTFTIEETILEVKLEDLILPGDTAVIEMEFFAQVPKQIRRSGRDNKEGIDYSMAQWYPKLCAYDSDGWHPNPYIGREFYGNWGDFDVNITISKNFVVCGTGIPDSYEGTLLDDKEQKIWKFKANNVHDFMWAADRDYVHKWFQTTNGPMVHLYYQEDPDYIDAWQKFPEFLDKMFELASNRFGKYPYPVFYVVQGGDGGMEYPMATLITGKRSLASLVGVVSHELMHSWYQGVLGFNESLYPWMDEGFTTYASDIIFQQLLKPNSKEDPLQDSYKSYFQLVKSGSEEPLITHADHYQTNTAYGMASYSKGCIFLHQLSYIVGQNAFNKGMLEFFRDWSFKHPSSKIFIRTMEKTSGMVLDWYLEYWVNSTHTIDYKIKDVKKKWGNYNITLERVGYMPMPIDVVITFEDQSTQAFNRPLPIMRGSKQNDLNIQSFNILQDWQWPDNEYIFKVKSGKKIAKVEIDPSRRMADIMPENNIFVYPND